MLSNVEGHQPPEREARREPANAVCKGLSESDAVP